ncbi:MAG TPA: T9SS type A sorting domain-containing protein [Balneolales bacterium]|nr:T9SS type A sorting domain-containing protein [Balneolales bacterium]
MVKRVTVFLLYLSFVALPSFAAKINNTTSVQPISISEARKQPVGSTVTIAGRVSVSGQLGGPAYMQDSTAGIALYDSNLYSSIVIGDTLVVTGQLSDYHDLLELTNITIVYQGNNQVIPQPIDITTNTITESFEGRLIAIKQATYGSTGTFQGDTNYQISDASGTAEVRIDKDTDIPGNKIPGNPTTIVGVVGEYNGAYQILPRDIKDAGAESYYVNGADVPLGQTFDVATWNLEWFGAANQGPSDDSLQIANVANVLKKMDADLYAVEEVSDNNAFKKLLSLLPGYRGFEANYSQTQKTAFIYKTSTIDSLSSRLLEPAQYGSWDYYWANGRPPLEFVFNATINGITKQFYAFDIHAKAMSDPTSYDRRVNASRDLKDYLDNNMSAANIIILGDYNDDVDASIYNDAVSPYSNFVQDSTNYRVVTSLLSKRKEASTTGYGEMIDHITISNELYPVFFDSTQQVINPTYINNYSYTTSDHYPVWARFKFDLLSSVNETQPNIPDKTYLSQNYPNPFNPTTNIQFTLNVSQAVSLDVYNLLGQKVAALIDHKHMSSGEHTVTFNASGLPSGIYFYRLELASGKNLTKKMTLMK